MGGSVMALEILAPLVNFTSIQATHTVGVVRPLPGEHHQFRGDHETNNKFAYNNSLHAGVS